MKILAIVALIVFAALIRSAEETEQTSLRVQHGKNVGKGFLINDGKYALTVAHVLRDEKGEFNVDAVVLNGKGSKVLVVSTEYDLALIDAADIQGSTFVPTTTDTKKGDGIKIIVGKRSHTGTVSDLDTGSGPNKRGNLVEIKCYYELGFSGSPIVELGTGLLVGMSSAGYIAKRNRAGKPVEAKNDKGLIVPASTIIRFLAAAERRLKAPTYDGQPIRLTVKEMN